MSKKTDEKSLITETYSASLQPEKLGDFEKTWENYIDSRQAESNASTLDDTFLKSHFATALQIVERIRHDYDKEDFFERLLKGQPGFALVINADGNIIYTNTDAESFIETASSLHQTGMSNVDSKDIVRWCQQQSNESATPTSKYRFIDVNLGNNRNETLLITPVGRQEIGVERTGKEGTYFLISRVDLEVRQDFLPALHEKFSLTSSEAIVSMHLANGLSVKEISQFRQTSELTVRTQIGLLPDKWPRI